MDGLCHTYNTTHPEKKCWRYKWMRVWVGTRAGLYALRGGREIPLVCRESYHYPSDVQPDTEYVLWRLRYIRIFVNIFALQNKFIHL